MGSSKKPSDISQRWARSCLRKTGTSPCLPVSAVPLVLLLVVQLAVQLPEQLPVQLPVQLASALQGVSSGVSPAGSAAELALLSGHSHRVVLTPEMIACLLADFRRKKKKRPQTHLPDEETIAAMKTESAGVCTWRPKGLKMSTHFTTALQYRCTIENRRSGATL